MKRYAPLTRSPIAKVNRKRQKASFSRSYGSPERVAWIRSLPCALCGVTGYSQNAHVGTADKGAGRKANADQIAPLCGSREGRLGCHEKFDRWVAPCDRPSVRAEIVQAAQTLAAEWEASEAL